MVFAWRCATATSMRSCRCLRRLEDYVVLVAAVGRAAAAVACTVVIQLADMPPRDPARQVLTSRRTPWSLRSISSACRGRIDIATTQTLDEGAADSRVRTEKSTPTVPQMHGGGNHATLGGAKTCSELELLRRPDPSGGLVTGSGRTDPAPSYWRFLEPSLGPTSQAPRVDEARRRIRSTSSRSPSSRSG